MDGAKGMPAARKASGLGSWAFADVPDRACTALRKALKRAVEQITAAHPVIGQHLAQGDREWHDLPLPHAGQGG